MKIFSMPAEISLDFLFCPVLPCFFGDGEWFGYFHAVSWRRFRTQLFLPVEFGCGEVVGYFLV
jgi:hypothetical protein